nr:hypothetical protein [Microbacterium hydrocarbonoxydans]
MFEHPYLAHRSTLFDQEQLARAAERRRVIEEHPDRILRRQPGPIRRLVLRVLHTTDASHGAATDAGRHAGRRAPGACEPAPAR